MHAIVEMLDPPKWPRIGVGHAGRLSETPKRNNSFQNGSSCIAI